MSVLLVDIGNSRIKWALDQDGGYAAQGSHLLDEANQFANALGRLIKPVRIVVSNVAGERGEQALEAAVSRWGIVPEWITASHQACGVRNCYAIPQMLGPDRWAALIAAHSLHAGGCLVVSLGTALTIDWLREDGDFAGGLIVPGRRLMRDALSGGTSRVGRQAGKVAGFSCNTADAVESGVAFALAGAVKQARQQAIDSSGTAPAILISGGDGEWLGTLLDLPVTVVPDLVLKGLALMARMTN